MKALAVSHNGQKVALVGAPGNCWVKVGVDGLATDYLPQATFQFLLQLIRVPFSDGPEVDPIPDTWPTTELAVGDEITIRIVDVESDDPPPKHVPRRPRGTPQRQNPGGDFDFNSRFGRFK